MSTKCPKIKFSQKQEGFSLIELIVVMFIGIIVVTLLSVSAISGFRNIQASKRIQQLHSDATYITDTLSYYTKQATFICVKSGANCVGTAESNLVLTLPNGSTKTFALAGGKITLDGSPITNGNISASNLNFVALAHSVHIVFTLSIPYVTATNKPVLQTISISTTVAQRNQ